MLYTARDASFTVESKLFGWTLRFKLTMKDVQINVKSSTGIRAWVRVMIGGPVAVIHAPFAGKQGNKPARVATTIFPELVGVIKARHLSKLQF